MKVRIGKTMLVSGLSVAQVKRPQGLLGEQLFQLILADHHFALRADLGDTDPACDVGVDAVDDALGPDSIHRGLRIRYFFGHANDSCL